MIGRNTKNKRNRNVFRSYNNINNYNNFLLELDEMQKQKINDISNMVFTTKLDEKVKTGSNPNCCAPPNICNPSNTCAPPNCFGFIPAAPTLNPYINNNIPNVPFNMWGSVPIYNNPNTNPYSTNIYGNNPNNVVNATPSPLGTNARQKFFLNTKSFKSALEPELINILKHNEQFKKEQIKEKPVIHNKISIEKKINNINDLIQLTVDYPNDPHTEYNINMELLHNIKEPLLQLNHMIGMKQVKENIVDQILYYMQSLNDTTNDFMHTVIYGPPGTGKTEVAKIIGSIFSKMGVLTKGTFKKVTRTDLIAGYLGQTAIKTNDVITSALGGVLFIDEAYALGNTEKRDSFSKECIDTLCEALSNHKDNLMVIIAGYEKELSECFFKSNQGLDSRFTWRFHIDEYTAADLHAIFVKKVGDIKWSIGDENINVKWFEKNKANFKFFGRDIETLLAKTKIAHSRRVFCLDKTMKKQITIDDLNNGLDMFVKNENSSSKKEEELTKYMLNSMYC